MDEEQSAAGPRRARSGERLKSGETLVPYVADEACAEAYDRIVHDDLGDLRVVRADLPERGQGRRSVWRYEPSPVHPTWVVAVLLVLALLWLAVQVGSRLLLAQ